MIEEEVRYNSGQYVSRCEVLTPATAGTFDTLILATFSFKFNELENSTQSNWPEFLPSKAAKT